MVLPVLFQLLRGSCCDAVFPCRFTHLLDCAVRRSDQAAAAADAAAVRPPGGRVCIIHLQPRFGRPCSRSSVAFVRLSQRGLMDFARCAADHLFAFVGAAFIRPRTCCISTAWRCAHLVRRGESPPTSACACAATPRASEFLGPSFSLVLLHDHDGCAAVLHAWCAGLMCPRFHLVHVHFGCLVHALTVRFLQLREQARSPRRARHDAELQPALPQDRRRRGR